MWDALTPEKKDLALQDGEGSHDTDSNLEAFDTCMETWWL